MPKGIEVLLDDGQAVIDFVDPSLKGPALAKLIEIGGPETISVDTRSGPRKRYIVPEGNAAEAGLIDHRRSNDSLEGGDTGFASDLASASSQGARPVVHTAKDHAYVGTTPQEEILGNTSVATVVSSKTRKVPARPKAEE